MVIHDESPPKRGARWDCLNCGQEKSHYSRGLCRNCYRRQYEDDGLRRARRAAKERQKRAEAKLPYRIGSWQDPTVQAHHRAMLRKYFPVEV